ncbi:hypothetical protein RFI_15422 [Reticulomyxa filosa]|uniref:Kelch motif family protein n=1 Tax=Reticulomyxa filosa TaxID=46433 RepID=X6N6W1_RETFI|nr:hypothetical protein RFI_15422 [Reticulomyxa filosa]|eukprot:ETO21781.1 hypothetical protein RFI_15422 [Reticulomyxa filosa]
MKSLNRIKNGIIPKEKYKFGIQYHCFVPLTMNNEKMINHFILFCYNTGLLIKYDEQDKTFGYEKLPICHSLDDFNMYSFVYVYDYIFLFGGADSEWRKTKLVYKYSMKDKTWNECKITLPMKIRSSFAILNGDYTNIHVIGGNANYQMQSTHMSVNVEQLFEKSELLKMLKTYELKKEIIRLKEITIRAKRKAELLKKVTTRIKFERPYVIPIEKERHCDEMERIKKNSKIPQEWKSRNIGMEVLNKQLKEWDEEKRMELNEMNWDDIWSFDGTFEQARSNDYIRSNSISSIIKTLLGHRTAIKIKKIKIKICAKRKHAQIITSTNNSTLNQANKTNRYESQTKKKIFELKKININIYI